MAVFASTDELYWIMGALLARIRDDAAIASRLAEGNLVLRFLWRDPDGEATIDLRHEPITFTLGACDVEPDVEMAQSADIAHRFWLGRLNVAQAIAMRQVVARGSVPKALRLLPAIKPAFDLYPQVLADLGRSDLVTAAKGRPRHRRGLWASLLAARDRGRLPVIDDDSLNAHFIPIADAAAAKAPAPRRSGLPDDPGERRCELLRRMTLVRAFEEHLALAYADGTLPTEAIHLSVGQEATAVGACAALAAADTIATTHRGHGHMLAKGADLDGMMAEIYGKSTGLCGGKGGSMHVTDARVGGLGANGIVGASLLVATGAALATRLARGAEVSVAFCGDGATNHGMFHEAVNFAAVLDLPVVFVVENNHYGEFTPLERHTRVPNLATRAAAYGIPGVRVDGNDVRAVLTTVSDAVQRARGGDGPTLVESVTYRLRGHMEGETARYRSDEEIAAWRQLDPILVLQRELTEENVLSDDAAEAMRTDSRAAVDRAAAAARSAPEPQLESLTIDVFAPEPRALFEAGEPPAAGREVTCSAALLAALAEEMDRDPTVFLLGEDVSQGGYFAVTTGLADRFPDRVLDTPISEYAIVGAAVGAAMAGRRPVAEILFSDFLTTCMDPLVNQAAKLRYMSGGQYALPLVVRTPGGAGLGMAAQHSQSLEALFTGIPGLVVMAPSTPADAKGMLKCAIRSSNPVLFLENKLLYLETGPVPDGDHIVPIGRAATRRHGNDVTVVAIGGILPATLAAVDRLAEDGVAAEVIDPRTLVPLDSASIVRSVARTGRLVTVEEGPLTHGFGSEVIARVAESLPPSALKARPRRVAGLDVPIPYARNLERAALPDEESIAEAILAVCGG